MISIDSLTENEVLFTVTVPARATVGLKDVTVVNSGGQATTAPEILAVVDEMDTMDPGPRPKKDGGCRTAGAPDSVAWIVFPLLILGLLRRRRTPSTRARS